MCHPWEHSGSSSLWPSFCPKVAATPWFPVQRGAGLIKYDKEKVTALSCQRAKKFKPLLMCDVLISYFHCRSNGTEIGIYMQIYFYIHMHMHSPEIPLSLLGFEREGKKNIAIKFFQPKGLVLRSRSCLCQQCSQANCIFLFCHSNYCRV